MEHDWNEARSRTAAAAVIAAAGWLLTACTEDPATGTVDPSICGASCGDASLPPGSAGTGVNGGGFGVAGGLGPGGSPLGAGGTTAIGGAPAGAAGGAPAGATTAGATPGGTTGGTGGAAGGGDLPCDVKAIVQQRCGSCHGATPASSPMSLVTHANWHAQGTTDRTKQYYQLAKLRINDTTKPMPPPSIGMLTADEKAKLNAWLDQNAPAGTTSCMNVPTGPGEIDTTGLECYKLLAHAPGSKTAKYNVGAAVDAYVNFGFKAPWQGTLYLQVIKPVIDNATALHHWLLYRETVTDGSVEPTIGQHAGELLNGWAPGGALPDLRSLDVGQELPATSYSVEMHYNSSDPNAQDASGVELCGKKTPPKHIASLSWLGYDQGGTISYATGLCLEPSTSWTGTCNPGHTQPIHLVTITPHLHQSGRHLKAVINGPNGSRILHDKPFDFAYQVTYTTDEVLMPGESITTTCTFSAPNCAGQSTQQEMCYLFTLAYPKQTLVDFGLEGTLMHGEGVCLGQ
jgi:hypothetical protein